MAVNVVEPACGFQCFIQGCQQGMFYFNFTAAGTADDVMVLDPRDLVSEMSARGMGGPHQTVIGKEFEGAVNSRFCETGRFPDGFFVDLGWGEMLSFVVKDMQDRHSLGGHSVPASAELKGILG
jgi:hypothetical protein